MTEITRNEITDAMRREQEREKTLPERAEQRKNEAAKATRSRAEKDRKASRAMLGLPEEG